MEIAIVVLSVLLIFFMYRTFKLAKQNVEMAEAVLSIADLNDTNNNLIKEDFLKFISDSRDWAFDYIEEVQNGLSKFIKEVEPDIEYYDKYGTAVEGMVSPHDKALKKISEEFKELKKLLPKDN